VLHGNPGGICLIHRVPTLELNRCHLVAFVLGIEIKTIEFFTSELEATLVLLDKFPAVTVLIALYEAPIVQVELIQTLALREKSGLGWTHKGP
jgi:hypothetical protein